MANPQGLTMANQLHHPGCDAFFLGPLEFASSLLNCFFSNANGQLTAASPGGFPNTSSSGGVPLLFATRRWLKIKELDRVTQVLVHASMLVPVF